METWLEVNQTIENEYELAGYCSNLNSIGRGRGIATYCKPPNKHSQNVNCEGFSISKVKSEKLDIIGIYRSQEGNVTTLITKLEKLIEDGRTTVVGGDINVCALAHPSNYVTQSLIEKGFKQIVRKATQIEGGLIDHVYLKQGKNHKFSYIIENFPKYYSDYDGIGLILSEDQEN